jgi:hypothetical protein
VCTIGEENEVVSPTGEENIRKYAGIKYEVSLKQGQ